MRRRPRGLEPLSPSPETLRALLPFLSPLAPCVSLHTHVSSVPGTRAARGPQTASTPAVTDGEEELNRNNGRGDRCTDRALAERQCWGAHREGRWRGRKALRARASAAELRTMDEGTRAGLGRKHVSGRGNSLCQGPRKEQVHGVRGSAVVTRCSKRRRWGGLRRAPRAQTLPPSEGGS